MARILFCWELGGDYGHLSRLLPIALALRERGHEPVFAVRDLLGAEALLHRHQLRWLQAPLWIGQVTGLPPPISHAELLMRFGFLNTRALTGVARAWRAMIDLVQPDLLVMDHAPTALLATRGLDTPRVNLGDGFCIPPGGRPMPPFRWWQPENMKRVADSEAHVWKTANEVLFALDAPPLASLSELTACDASLMLGFAELDHYPDHPGAHWLGPLFSLGQGSDVIWPEGSGPRVFAYLKPGYPAIDAALGALAKLPARVLAHVPGASAQTVATFSRGSMRVSVEPLDMEAARRDCDLAVCHGGNGTVSAMLLAGKPLVVLPSQMEQVMTAKRLETLGVATVVMPDAAAAIAALFRKALSNAALGQAARAFAQRHTGYEPQQTIRAVADRCETLLEPHR